MHIKPEIFCAAGVPGQLLDDDAVRFQFPSSLMERIVDTDIFYSLLVLLFAVSVIHHSSGVADSGGGGGGGGGKGLWWCFLGKGGRWAKSGWDCRKVEADSRDFQRSVGDMSVGKVRQLKR